MKKCKGCEEREKKIKEFMASMRRSGFGSSIIMKKINEFRHSLYDDVINGESEGEDTTT